MNADNQPGNKSQKNNSQGSLGHDVNQNVDHNQDVAFDQNIESAEGTPAPSHASGQSSGIGQMFTDSLPPQGREMVERIVNESDFYVDEVRRYVRTNPREALGLAATFGMVLWALFGTKPGRRLVDMGTAAAKPVVSGWLSQGISQVATQVTQNTRH